MSFTLKSTVSGEVGAVRVRYFPCRLDVEYLYRFGDDSITVTSGSNTEIFDFSGLPDGESAEIQSAFDPCPVLAAERANGELIVTLLRPIGPRPRPADYESEEAYCAALEAWKRLWIDDLETVFAG